MPDSITPPPELVTSLRDSAPHGIRDAGVTRELWLINHAYAAGADQELDACCEWLQLNYNYPLVNHPLRVTRRPKPPSLKEQALGALGRFNTNTHTRADEMTQDFDLIRAALEALDD